MNIAIITDDFIFHTNGIARSLINFRNGLEQLGEKIYFFNSTYHNPKNLCFKIISSKKSLKHIFNQKLSFFLFLFFIFYKILLFKGISFNNRLKLSYYYCIYPKNLVNRIITINNLFNAFNKFHIEIVFCAKSTQPLFYSYIISYLFRKPLMTLAHGDDFIMKYPFNLNSILFKKSDRIIVTNEVMKWLFIKIHKVTPNKVSIIPLSVDTNVNQEKEIKLEHGKSRFLINPKDILTLKEKIVENGHQRVEKHFSLNENSLEYQKLIKKTYFDYYYFCEGDAFRVKLNNPFQI